MKLRGAADRRLKGRYAARSSGGAAPWLLMAAVFTASMGYGAVLPLLQFVLVRSGVAVTRASVSSHTALLTGTYMLAFAVSSPAWGKAADTWGRRVVILGSMAGLAATSAAFALPTELWAAYGLRGLNGAFAAGALPPRSRTSLTRARGRSARAESAASRLGLRWASSRGQPSPGGSPGSIPCSRACRGRRRSSPFRSWSSPCWVSRSSPPVYCFSRSRLGRVAQRGASQRRGRIRPGLPPVRVSHSLRDCSR